MWKKNETRNFAASPINCSMLFIPPFSFDRNGITHWKIPQWIRKISCTKDLTEEKELDKKKNYTYTHPSIHLINERESRKKKWKVRTQFSHKAYLYIYKQLWTFDERAKDKRSTKVLSRSSIFFFSSRFAFKPLLKHLSC